jgi:hypothetical protein
MVKVLFITEKWHDHNHRENGLTNNMYNLIGSYECSGYGTFKHCPLSPEEIWSSEGVDKALLENDYDAAIISVYYHLPSHHVAKQVGHKTFMFWWDAIASMGQIQQWSSLIHQGMFDWGKGEELPNCYSLEVPQDTRIFRRDETVKEDIDISFIGSLNPYWTDRFPIIQMIEKDKDFNFWWGGGRHPGTPATKTNLPIEEYANIHRRSKLCLNLSIGHGKPQRKGRAFEIAASGQFMLTTCPETFRGKDGEWFEDGVDYVSVGLPDMVYKIRYYLDRPEEVKRMKDNMYKKYNENYGPKQFWKKILGICGVSL